MSVLPVVKGRGAARSLTTMAPAPLSDRLILMALLGVMACSIAWFFSPSQDHQIVEIAAESRDVDQAIACA